MSTPSGATASTHVGVAGGRRAQDCEVRHGLPHAVLDIEKHALGRNGEVLDSVRHARAVGIADADDFRVRMLVRLAQEVAHMGVLETDPDDALLSHILPPSLTQLVALFQIIAFRLSCQDSPVARMATLNPSIAPSAGRIEFSCDHRRKR